MTQKKDKRGGKRLGAGRPPKYHKCLCTKQISVPEFAIEYIDALIRLQIEWAEHDKDPSVCILNEIEEKHRNDLVELLSELIKYEKERQEKLQKSEKNHKLDKFLKPLFENL